MSHPLYPRVVPVTALSLLLAASVCLRCHSTLQAERPPDSGIILSDDRGDQDLGCFGSPELRTPGLDQVAEESMKSDFRFSPAHGLGPEKGVMRRDPSDVIRAGDLYHVWYTKGAQAHGYDATVWYASSTDGRQWTERGEALARGPQGSWDEQSVFTPNILVAEDRYWLFYTAVPKPFFNSGPDITKTAIGVAVADSPDGPWRKLDGNPVLTASDDPKHFDSMRVDDACLVVRRGKYFLYYKGRQWNNTPGKTRMGVAIADKPQGPYVKYRGNPVVNGGHEVLVWPYGNGTVALVNIGPPGIARTLQYSEDGLDFTRWAGLKRVPSAAGAFRPEAFTDSGRGDMIRWGISIGRRKGLLPFLERFDCRWVGVATQRPGNVKKE